MENLPPKPENNLVWAVLCTCMCCLPLGVMALLSATKVDNLYAAGNYAEAEAEAAKAKKYSIWGAVIGAICGSIYLIFVFGLNIFAAMLN